MAEDQPTNLDRLFGAPSWGGGRGDFYREEQYLPPGAYPMPAKGADAALSRLIEQLSPLLGNLAKLANIDEKIVGALTRGAGVLSTRGSMFEYTNPANVLFNQQMANAMRTNMAGFNTVVAGAQQNMTANLYQRAFGLSPDDARQRAAAAATNPLNPMYWASQYMFNQYDMAGMRRGLTGAALLGGVITAPSAQLAGRQALFGSFSQQLAAMHGSDPFMFGGLRGGEIGQLTGAMISRGMMDFRGGSQTGIPGVDAGANTGMAAQMALKVKGMANALAPLRDLFKDSIPELLNRVEDALGVSVATFGPAELQGRLLRMKHTARLAGVSVETIMGMSGAARQMLGEVGIGGMGADVAAGQAASMLGAGADMRRINPQEFQQQVLRNVTGRQASQAAKELSGALVLARAGGMYKGMTDAEAASAFQKLVGADVTTGNLVKVLRGQGINVSGADIVQAGASTTAEDLRTGTDLSMTLGETSYKQYRQYAGRLLGSQARQYGNTAKGRALQAAARIMGAGKTAIRTDVELAAALKAEGIDVESAEGKKILATVSGTFFTMGNVAAEAQGLGDLQKAEAEWQATQRQQEIGAKRDKLAKAESDILKTTKVRYGLLGLLSGEGKNLGKIATDLLGVPVFAGTTEAARKALGDISGETGAGMVNEALRTLYTGVNEAGEDMDPAKLAAFRAALENKGATAESITAAAQELMGGTQQGKAAAAAAARMGAYEGEEWTKVFWGKDEAGRTSMLKATAARESIKEALGESGKGEAVLKKYEETGSLEDALSSVGLTKAEREKVGKSYADIGQEMGLQLKAEAPDLLQILVDVLKGLDPLLRSWLKKEGVTE